MCPRTKKRPWSQRGEGNRPFMGKPWGPAVLLSPPEPRDQRRRSQDRREVGGRVPAEDSKFRQQAYGMGYKGAGALRAVRDFSNPGKREFRVGALHPHQTSPHLEGNCLSWKWGSGRSEI